MIYIGKFKKSLEENFNLEGWKMKVQDGRKRPIISPETIFNLVMEMVFFDQKSLLEVDEFDRKVWALTWYKSKRKQVASDTTIERSMEGANIEILQNILKDAYKSLGNLKASSKILPSGKSMRVEILDGSDFGGFHGVVFTIAGMVNTPLDIEPYSMGKELEASRKILSRIKAKFGKGCVDITLEDGLHMSKEDILHCKLEFGSEVLIKTDEETLTIVQDAKGLFFRVEPELGGGIEGVEGVDAIRNVEYRITACADFRWQDMPFEFKVAHVWERKLKPVEGRPEIEKFWVITTDTSLSDEDMRELAHFR